MPKNNVNPYELDILAESTHTIPTTSFKSNTIQIYNTTFTFESIITKANVPVGKGVTVYIYHKGLGTLLSKTETDEESKVYVPNLSKHNEYMVVAVDPKDIYNSVIFDINFDLSSKLNNNVTLKYYSIYDVPNLQQLYSYWDTTTDQRIDPSVLFFISNPNFKDDLGLIWGMTGTVRSTTIEGARAFTFSNSGENIYVYHNPVPPKSAFTFSAYIYVDSNNRNTTTNNNIFKHNTQSLYIDSNLKLNYKNTDSSNTFHVMSNTSVNLDSWNHVSISFDNSKLYLFINGVLQASVPNSGGMSYSDSTFIIGDSFKGYITQPLMNDICKYTEDFDFLLKAFSYKTNVYSDPTDTLAEYVRVKLSSTRLTYGLRDEVNNISFSSGLENKYFTPLSTNTRMLAYTKQEPKVALGNRDFCIELKVKFKSMTGYPRLICNNNNTWTTNCWTLDVNRTDSANLYSLHVYNIGNWTFNYPVILNELVDLALVREGVNLKYYVNGYLDKTINIGTGSFDDSTTSFIAMAYTMNINFYELRITTNHSRYTTTYEPKQLEWPDNELAFDQYKIINMPFKQYTSDNQSVLSFTNTNVSLSTDESLNGTKSAYFNNSKIVSNSKLLITNEKFTIEMFYKPKVESLTGVVSIVSILNSFRLGTKEGLLSFFNGATWEDSTYLLDDKKFNHIVIQRTGSTIKLLADGNLVLTTTYTIPSGLKTITIGCFNDTEYVNGYVNNLIMYKNITKFEDQYTVPTEEIIVKPPVDLQPEVIVNQYTTSALDFENGLIDKIGTTVWNKQGTGNVISVNKIFGDNSFETKALGDSLYTNSNIITGGATPFTIEFYALLNSFESSSGNYMPIISSENGFYNIIVGRHKVTSNLVFYTNQQVIDQTSNKKLHLNEINKFSMSYDGAAFRVFVNDEVELVVGISNVQWYANTHFLRDPINNRNHYGLIDNINIFDGEARVVRDYDEHADKLVVDLAFDGENNSTKIVDNGILKSSWNVYGNAKISTDQKFDGFSSLNTTTSNSSYIESSNFSASPTDKFTAEFQYNVSAEVGSPSVVQFYYDGWYYLMLSVSLTGNIQVNVNGTTYITKTVPNLSNDVKYRMVYDNKVIKLYINDIIIQEAITNGVNLPVGTKLSIGKSSSSNPIYIKNFKIYKDVAVIPESPVGKIQLDFDNNVIDKYNNSTWINNGVTFNNINSIKGSAGYFNGSSNLQSNSNSLLNFENKNFNIEFDGNKLNNNQTYSSWLTPNGASYPSQWCELSSWNTNLQRFQNLAASAPELTGAVLNLNTWYKWQLIRNNGTVILKANDVVTGISNYTPSMNVNFSNGTGTNLIGVSSNAMNCYVDNFKSEKDYQGDIVVDKPAVHLPLETNAVNISYSNLTINSVGSPTYTTVDGRKCIKFESGKYLTIDSNNIFNLGTNSDFYLEMDVYVDQEVSLRSLITNSSETDGVYIINGRCYLLFNNSYSVISDNICSLNKWTKIIIKRTGSDVYLDYDGVLKLMSSSNAFNLSVNTRLSYNTNGVVQYITNFKMFVGTSEIPETYNDKKVLDLDFKPTRKSYLFKDNNNKCVIHPVNITQRDYQDSQYCCTFNGTDQYLSLGKNDLLNFGKDDFVLNFKIKPKFSSNSIHSFSRIIAPRFNSKAELKEYIMLPGENYSQQSYRGAVMVVLDEATQVFMGTPRLNETEINSVTLVRSGNVFSLYLNEILSVEKTFTGDFNLNRYGETIIGASRSSSEVVSYLNATLYSIKILRNTSDMSLLDSSNIISETAPIAEIDLKINNNTLIDNGSSKINWISESAVLNSDYFTGVYKASPNNNLLQSFYKNSFVLDIICDVNRLSNIIKQWSGNLRYQIQISTTELIFSYYYTYSGGYTIDTITCPITVSNFTRVTLLVNNSRVIKIYVNGNEISIGNIMLKNSFFNDVNEEVRLGDPNLKIKQFRLYNSQSNYINPI